MLSFSSPRLAANSESSLDGGVSDAVDFSNFSTGWDRDRGQRGSRLVNYSSASSLHSSLWWVFPVGNLETGQNTTQQNKTIIERSVLITSNTKAKPRTLIFLKKFPHKESANFENALIKLRDLKKNNLF